MNEMDLDPLLLSRLQFVWVIAWHILLPALTVGLASYIAVLEGVHFVTGRDVYLRASTFWIKIFSVSFGMGVVSGIVMPFQFGTNWSRFSDVTANIISPLLAYEGLTAFFLEAAFLGVKAAVLVIVIEALLKLARRALLRPHAWAIAAAAFAAIFFFAVPFPLIIAAAAALGFLVAQAQPAAKESTAAELAPSVPLIRSLGTICLWLAIWIAPLLMTALLFGRHHVTTDIALFFSKLAVVTFGGAYAVLAYMAQQAVETYGWLKPGEMLDGLGLAETTPGPLILVTEFVGFIAAYRQGGEPKIAFGLLGAAITLWATFAPCFLWIFAGAPYIERLSASPKLAGALGGVTAAVVGVILNLSLWFGLNVLFGRVEAEWHGPLRIWNADIASLNVEALLLALFAAALLLWLRAGIAGTLALTAGAALAWSFV